MIRVIRGHGMTRELREGLFASLVMIVMIITGCTGPSPAPAPHSTIASPAASTASDLEAAIRSGDLETLEIALAGGADANAPFALGFPITGLVGSDLRAAYARWVKFNALLFSTIYTHLSRFCPEAERKNQEMLSEAVKSIRGDPRRILAIKDYRVIKGITGLHFSALMGRADMVTSLLRGRANVAAPDSYGHQPLHYASSLEVTRILLDAGATVDCRTLSGLTPLHLVCDRESAQLLLDRGAPLEVTDDCGNTPLHIIAARSVPCPRSSENSTRVSSAAATITTGTGTWAERATRLAQKMVNGLERLQELGEKLCLEFSVYALLVEKGAILTVMNEAGSTPGGIYEESQRMSFDD